MNVFRWFLRSVDVGSRKQETGHTPKQSYAGDAVYFSGSRNPSTATQQLSGSRICRPACIWVRFLWEVQSVFQSAYVRERNSTLLSGASTCRT